MEMSETLQGKQRARAQMRDCRDLARLSARMTKAKREERGEREWRVSGDSKKESARAIGYHVEHVLHFPSHCANAPGNSGRAFVFKVQGRRLEAGCWLLADDGVRLRQKDDQKMPVVQSPLEHGAWSMEHGAWSHVIRPAQRRYCVELLGTLPNFKSMVSRDSPEIVCFQAPVPPPTHASNVE